MRVKIRAWERMHVLKGRTEHVDEAVLYEQPLRDYLFARVMYWLWRQFAKIAPKMSDPGRDKKDFGWRLRYELWSSYDLHHKNREELHSVSIPTEDDCFW